MEEVTATLNRCDGDAETTINKLLDHCYPHTVILNEPAASCSYLESAPGPSCTSISSESDATASLEDILQAHSQKSLTSRVYDLEVDNSRLWCQSSMFYKRAMHSPECLHYKFGVEFVGEEGVDAGECQCILCIIF